MQSIRITYPHTYVADSDELIFSGRAGEELKVTGFSQGKIVVLDITNPDQPVQLTSQVATEVNSNAGKFGFAVQVPWSTSNSTSSARHILMAVADDQVATAAGLRQNHPSHWHRAQAGSEIVMVSAEAFAGALTPLLHAHQAEGKSSTVVLIDELYDEFNFGEHSPLAIRDVPARRRYRTGTLRRVICC